MPLILIRFSNGYAQAQPDTLTEFTSSDRMLSFKYSRSLTIEQLEIPQAIVALRQPSAGYPSFNILVSAEPYQPAAIDEKAYRQKIINDYRAVGIGGVKSLRTYSAPLAGSEVKTAEVRYQFKDQTLIAAVTLVPASQGRHYILTYIDLADQFYRRKQLREDIVNSMTISTSATSIPSTETVQEEPPALPPFYWAIAVALLGAVFAAGSKALKRREKSGTP